MTDTHTDCRTRTGVTVGAIDAVITLCRIIRAADLSPDAVIEALADLRSDEDVRAVVSGSPETSLPGVGITPLP